MSDTKPDPDIICQIDNEGKIRTTTQEKIWDAIKECKSNLLSELKDCIENEKPFLLVISTSEELKIENLRTTTSLNSHEIVVALSPIFCGVPFKVSSTIIKEISDVVLLKLIEDICRNHVDQRILNSYLNKINASILG